MRITGGRARGIPLKAPKGGAVRPATDRMREAVFSSLGECVEGARFFDVFAGTGAYGLEALSRGAVSGVFVDRSRAAVKVLKENIEKVERSLGASKSAVEVCCRDALSWQPASGGPATLVFADPPYRDLGIVLPRLAERLRVWSDSTRRSLLILETPGDDFFEIPGWRCARRIGKAGQGPRCGIWEPVRGAPDQG